MKNHNNTRKKASAVSFSVIMVLSMVAIGFAGFAGTVAANVDDTIDEDDYDRNITQGQTVYQGQLGLIELPVDYDDSQWELRRVDDGEVRTLVSTPSLVDTMFNGETYALINTENRDIDNYILTNASMGTSLDNISDTAGDQDYYGVQFENVIQDLDVEFDKDPVSIAGDTEVEIDVSSDIRNNYVVTFTADGLDEDDLEGLFNTTDNDDVTDRYVNDGNFLRAAIYQNRTSEGVGNYFLTDDAIHVFGLEEERTTLDFKGVNLGEYSFTVNIVDSTAEDTSTIEIVGEIIGPDDPPQYDLTLENDGTAYTVGFPGPTDGTLSDVFADGFDGVSAVYEYEASTNNWVLLEGDDFDKSLAALDAIVVVTAGDDGPDYVNLEVTFASGSPTSPTSRTLEEGWAFTTAATADDVETVFDRGSAEVTVVLDAFAGPDVQQADTAQSFQYQQPTPHYDLRDGDPPQMSPFAGYFVHVTESGSHPSLLSSIETRQEADAALNITDTS